VRRKGEEEKGEDGKREERSGASGTSKSTVYCVFKMRGQARAVCGRSIQTYAGDYLKRCNEIHLAMK
jgi:hypothetical protein